MISEVFALTPGAVFSYCANYAIDAVGLSRARRPHTARHPPVAPRRPARVRRHRRALRIELAHDLTPSRRPSRRRARDHPTPRTGDPVRAEHIGPAGDGPAPARMGEARPRQGPEPDQDGPARASTGGVR